MEKIWINRDLGSDKIIAIGNNSIYKANPKTKELIEFSENGFPECLLENSICIPFSSIRKINYTEGKKHIGVLHKRDSVEYLRISDSDKLYEIFTYFKENITGPQNSIRSSSPIQAAKLPIIAFLMLTLLFLWTSNMALKLEAGIGFETIGSGRSIFGIINTVASLGSLNIMLIFLTLLGSSFLIMIHRMNKRASTHEINFVKSNPK